MHLIIEEHRSMGLAPCDSNHGLCSHHCLSCNGRNNTMTNNTAHQILDIMLTSNQAEAWVHQNLDTQKEIIPKLPPSQSTRRGGRIGTLLKIIGRWRGAPTKQNNKSKCTQNCSTILAILDLMSSSAGKEKATTAHAHNNTLKSNTCDRFRASNKIVSEYNTS